MILSSINAAAGCLGDGCYIGGGGSNDVPFWGGVETTSYKLLLALHILMVVAAFGPTLVYPLLTKAANAAGGETGAMIANFQLKLRKRMFLPALIAAAVFGILLVADSSKVYDMSKPWVSAAFAVVIAIGLIAWFILRPAQALLVEALGKSPEDGARSLREARVKLGISTGLIHLSLVVLIILMIWQPGQTS